MRMLTAGLGLEMRFLNTKNPRIFSDIRAVI